MKEKEQDIHEKRKKQRQNVLWPILIRMYLGHDSLTPYIYIYDPSCIDTYMIHESDGDFFGVCYFLTM